jgi:hypothetical protein
MIILHRWQNDGTCSQCGKTDDGVRPQVCSGRPLKVAEERDELRRKLAGEAAHIKSLEGLLVDAANERDALRAEVEMLRGVGCREAKAGEPESGPCGVCLRCAEERGAEWAIRAKAQVVYTLVGDEAYKLLSREVCRNARKT